MKKRLTKLLAALLAVLTLVAVLSMSSFAATRTQSKTYKTYTVLGDSVAAGYSHPGYDMNHNYNKVEWNLVPNTYPDIVRKAVKATTVHQLAHSGYRSTDLRALLYNDYNGDGMSPLRLPSWNDDARHMNYDQLNVLRSAFQDDIRNSDLITVNIGINDATQPLLIAVETVQRDLGILGSEALAFLNPITLLQESLNNAALLGTDGEFYLALAQAQLTATRNFPGNFDAIIERIHQLNPKAKVVVIGLYHASENETLPQGGFGIPIGDVLGNMYQQFNYYMREGSPYAGKYYTYVDVWGISSHMNDPSSPIYRADSHPTLTGHGQIADKVLAVLPTK